MAESPFTYLPSEPWHLDNLSIKESNTHTRIEIAGWAFADPDKLDTPGQFLLNGRPFAQITYPIYREDVAKVFWQRKNSAYSGFHCVTSMPTADVYPDGGLEITFINPGPKRLLPAQQSWFVSNPSLPLPLPDETRRFRVIGATSAEHFTRGGFTDFKRMEAAIRFFTGKNLTATKNVLDFGCGCGRVARYVANLVALTGFDIDPDNVAWCAANLKGNYVVAPLNPPVKLAAGSFDVAYGISVFTHLREAMQDAWLAELSRLCAPGAFLFMTVHGETALNYAWQGPDNYWKLDKLIREQGLYVSDSNHQLDGYVEHQDQYVNVFHDKNYVQRHWNRYFEIVDILPGYIYTHDLVVMRKRPPLRDLAQKLTNLFR